MLILCAAEIKENHSFRRIWVFNMGVVYFEDNIEQYIQYIKILWIYSDTDMYLRIGSGGKI